MTFRQSIILAMRKLRGLAVPTQRSPRFALLLASVLLLLALELPGQH